MRYVKVKFIAFWVSYRIYSCSKSNHCFNLFENRMLNSWNVYMILPRPRVCQLVVRRNVEVV
jgi:hypothetical protein